MLKLFINRWSQPFWQPVHSSTLLKQGILFSIILELELILRGLWIWLPAFQQVNLDSISCLAHVPFEDGEQLVDIFLVIPFNISKDNNMQFLEFQPHIV